MGMEPRSEVTIKDFPGLITDADDLDVPPGAADEQVNITSLKVGELSVRAGLREVTFE